MTARNSEHLDDSDLVLFAAGVCSEARLREIGSHLVRCAQCLLRFDDYRAAAVSSPPRRGVFRRLAACAAAVLVAAAAFVQSDVVTRGAGFSVGRAACALVCASGLILGLVLWDWLRGERWVRRRCGFAILPLLAAVWLCHRVPPVDGPPKGAWAFSVPTYALIVAADRFPQTDLADLPYAADSAVRLAHQVEADGAKRVRTLVGPEANLRSVRSALVDTLRDARAAAVAAHAEEVEAARGEGRPPGRTRPAQVLIYLGSHGFVGRSDVAYVALHDTKKDDEVNTALSFSQVTELIADHGRTECRTLLVPDVCCAGRMGEQFCQLTAQLETRCGGLVVLPASDAAGQATESGMYGGSAMVRVLLEGLAGGADANLDQEVSIEEFAGLVAQRLPVVNPSAGRAGEAIRRYGSLWAFPSLLRRPGSEPHVPPPPAVATLVVTCVAPGAGVQIDGVRAGTMPGSGELSLKVAPGLHSIVIHEFAAPRREAEAAVEAAAGATVLVPIDLRAGRRPSVFGVISDTLPGHDIVYRPISYSGSAPVRVRPDAVESARAGKVGVRIEMDLTGYVGWAGVAWLSEGTWGQRPGVDLREYFGLTSGDRIRLVFSARGDNGGEVVEFKVGGVSEGPDKDALDIPAIQRITLGSEYAEYSIPLTDGLHAAGERAQVINAFAAVASQEDNGRSAVVVHVDEVRFVVERGGVR